MDGTFSCRNQQVLCTEKAWSLALTEFNVTEAEDDGRDPGVSAYFAGSQKLKGIQVGKAYLCIPYPCCAGVRVCPLLCGSVCASCILHSPRSPPRSPPKDIHGHARHAVHLGTFSLDSQGLPLVGLMQSSTLPGPAPGSSLTLFLLLPAKQQETINVYQCMGSEV